MSEKTIERIKDMEPRFDKASEVVCGTGEALDALEKTLPDILAFSEYYGSEDWFEDVDSYNKGEVPGDVKCGVLSEDLPYDLIIDAHELALRMLKAALAILEDI